MEGGLPKIVGAWTVCQFQGGLARKVGGVFEGGRVDTPCTLCIHILMIPHQNLTRVIE